MEDNGKDKFHFLVLVILSIWRRIRKRLNEIDENVDSYKCCDASSYI